MNPDEQPENQAPETPAPENQNPETATPETPAPEAPAEETPAVDATPVTPETPAIDPTPAATEAPAAVPTLGPGNPGHGLGIASLIFSLVGGGLIGIILGAIGLSKSKRVGQKNGLAVAGIIIGVLNVLVAITVLSILFAGLAAQCADLGPGVHTVGNVTYTCR